MITDYTDTVSHQPELTENQVRNWLDVSKPGDSPLVYYVGFSLPNSVQPVASILRDACERGEVFLTTKLLTQADIPGIVGAKTRTMAYMAIKVRPGVLAQLDRKMDY